MPLYKLQIADYSTIRQATSAQIKCWLYFLCVFFPVFFSELSMFNVIAWGKSNLVIWSITVLFWAKFWNLYENKSIYIRDNKDSTKNEGWDFQEGQWLTEHFSLICFMNCVWLINKAAVLTVIKPLKLSSVIGLMVIKFSQCMYLECWTCLVISPSSSCVVWWVLRGLKWFHIQPHFAYLVASMDLPVFPKCLKFNYRIHWNYVNCIGVFLTVQSQLCG